MGLMYTPTLVEALEEARVQVSILQDRLGIKDTGSGTLSIIDAALAAHAPTARPFNVVPIFDAEDRSGEAA